MRLAVNLSSKKSWSCSGFIDRGHDGRVFSKSTQVRMVGNSVNPMMAVGFLRANAPWLAVDTQEAA